MSSPGRKWLLRLLLVLASTVITLLLTEAAFRIYFATGKAHITDYRPSFYQLGVESSDRARFTSHPFLPYAPRPHDSRVLRPYRKDVNRVVECNYTNNSLGFRTPERPFQKPPNTKRIVTLGGSTTVDGPTNDTTWPALLEKRLNEHYVATGQKVEVINLAVDAAPSGYSLVNLALNGTAFAPDLVISYDGVNEIHHIGYDGLSPDYRSHMGKYDETRRSWQSVLPEWVFKSYFLTWASFKFDNLYGLSETFLWVQIYPPEKQQAIKPSRISRVNGVEYFERNLRLMRAIAAEYDATFLAATAHWVRPSDQIDLINEHLRKFFAAEKIDFLDLDRELPHDDWSIHVDQVHWSLKGEEEVAARWADKIVALDALNFNGRQTSVGKGR